MFARKVAVRLKPDALPEFARLMECEILPWLRQQQGFLDLITLVVPDGSEVATISFWDQEGNAQAYNSNGYPEALKMLEELLDGKPYVKTFHVVSSTLQKVPLPRKPEHRERGNQERCDREQESSGEADTTIPETGPIHLACH
jgi:hypothetical protein